MQRLAWALGVGFALAASSAAAQGCPAGYTLGYGGCYPIQQIENPFRPPAPVDPNRYAPHPNAIAPQPSGGIYNPNARPQIGGGVNPYLPVPGNPQMVQRTLPDGRVIYVPAGN